MIDEGTIDADLLKGMTKGKKMAAANIATLQDDSDLPTTLYIKYGHFMPNNPY
jgi:hypothetical protein